MYIKYTHAPKNTPFTGKLALYFGCCLSELEAPLSNLKMSLPLRAWNKSIAAGQRYALNISSLYFSFTSFANA